jgi:phosphatidylglycerophosphate synthase
MAILFTALLTDGLDGFLARKLQMQTRLGAILDPLTDKFFVLVALILCYNEMTLEPWQIAAFFTRDIALFILTVKAFFSGPLHLHPVKSVWPGKVTTCLQIVTLALLLEGVVLPLFVWPLFIALGILFFVSFLTTKQTNSLT